MFLFIAFRDLPRSILIGIPLVTGCYVLVNIAYLAVLSPAEIKLSSAVAVVSNSNHLHHEEESCSIFLAAYFNENFARHVQFRVCYTMQSLLQLVSQWRDKYCKEF